MAAAPIKVGILGVGRGMSFVKSAPHCGMMLAAVCDRWETKLRPYREQLNVATYTDYDAFLEHEMDAVVLANHFHQHAPFAVKALEAGFHVLSEIGTCGTWRGTRGWTGSPAGWTSAPMNTSRPASYSNSAEPSGKPT